MLSFTATITDHCRQVESFLHNLMPGATRGYMQKLIKSGHILLNDAATTPQALVSNNDTISLKESGKTAGLLTGRRPDVDILYEDDLIFVVNKNPGRSVHRTAEEQDMDLVAFCEEYMARRGTPCKLRPVNRLDRGTSGAVILAKSPTAAGILGRFVRDEGLGKLYLAVVEGEIAEKGEIDIPLEGKESLTGYLRIFQGKEHAIVAVYPVSGRMHQIRKHFSSFGHPVLGDIRYGGIQVKGLGGHALHAFAVTFPNPSSNNEMTIYAPLPGPLLELFRQVAGDSTPLILSILKSLKPLETASE
jgi:23S rRNA pseudouridine955/2504/2580 synthase